MMKQTGVDGIVVGRGCLGRPWLFRDLEQAIDQYLENPNAEISFEQVQPDLQGVIEAFRKHANLLVEFFENEEHACRDIRKHVAWYFKGYPVGGDIRSALARVESIEQMDEILSKLDGDLPYPGKEAEGPRGRQGNAKKKCVLPENWLDSRKLSEAHSRELLEAELSVSGG